MQNTMLLDSLVASAKGSFLNAPGRSSSAAIIPAANRSLGGKPSGPTVQKPFLNFLAERLNQTENSGGNQIQDNT